MDIDDLVLAVVEASGGEIKGRTLLQKLGYFISEIMDLDAGYEPHYYGPYSEAVASVIHSQVSRGLLEETMSLAGGFVGHDFARKLYRYKLVERGRKALEWRKEQPGAKEEFQRAKGIVGKIMKDKPSYEVLSWAATLYLVLLQQGGSPPRGAARPLAAGNFNWQMNEDEMQAGLDLLTNVGLVKTEE